MFNAEWFESIWRKIHEHSKEVKILMAKIDDLNTAMAALQTAVSNLETAVAKGAPDLSPTITAVQAATQQINTVSANFSGTPTP